MAFKPDGHTVHDFDERFRLEDMNLLSSNNSKFKWKQVELINSQLSYCKDNDINIQLPTDLICPNCKKNIFAKRGYEDGDAQGKHIAQCPNCGQAFISDANTQTNT